MTLDIPERIEKALGDTPEQSRRRALECMVVDAYKSQKLSRSDVRELLALSWQETEEFLARNGATYHYALPELDEDIETGINLLKQREHHNR